MVVCMCGYFNNCECFCNVYLCLLCFVLFVCVSVLFVLCFCIVSFTYILFLFVFSVLVSGLLLPSDNSFAIISSSSNSSSCSSINNNGFRADLGKIFTTGVSWLWLEKHGRELFRRP